MSDKYAILKLSWLERFLSSHAGRWVLFLDTALDMVFEYAPAYLEHKIETTSNPIWKYVTLKRIPAWACEKDASDLGLGGGFRRVLRFPPLLTTG